MRFQVPQFIGVEDRIFGPFTLKQFIYLAGGAGVSVILYRVLPFYIAILAIIPIAAFAGALAFYNKVNDKPFINIVESAVYYFFGSKLYIWKKEDKKIAPRKEEEKSPSMYIPKLSDSKLKDLTWSLDISNKKNS